MKEKFYFGFRYEKQLGARIREYCRKEMTSVNRLVQETLSFLAKHYDRGQMDLFEPSRFRIRPDKKDKESTSLVLTGKIREMVRNLAFTYRISMAEVIRLGLEMYLDTKKHDGELVGTIHTYRRPKPLIHTLIISLYPALPAGNIPYPLLL